MRKPFEQDSAKFGKEIQLQSNQKQTKWRNQNCVWGMCPARPTCRRSARRRRATSADLPCRCSPRCCSTPRSCAAISSSTGTAGWQPTNKKNMCLHVLQYYVLVFDVLLFCCLGVLWSCMLLLLMLCFACLFYYCVYMCGCCVVFHMSDCVFFKVLFSSTSQVDSSRVKLERPCADGRTWGTRSDLLVSPQANKRNWPTPPASNVQIWKWRLIM